MVIEMTAIEDTPWILVISIMTLTKVLLNLVSLVDAILLKNPKLKDVIVSSPRGSNGKGFIEILDSKLKRLHLIDGEQVF
jgi:hypothetical protein